MSGIRLLTLSLILFISPWLHAGTAGAENDPEESGLVSETLTNLGEFIELQSSLRQEIEETRTALQSAVSESEKQALTEELTKLQNDMSSLQQNFERVAAGIDLEGLRSVDEKQFNFQEELMSLVEPAVKEMKEMTSHVRQKSQLKETINYYAEKLPIAEKAIESLTRLIPETRNEKVREKLEALLEEWQQQQAFIQSEKHAAELQLEKLLSSETSFAESSGNYLKNFFKKRGRYLLQAILVVIAVLLVSRLSYRLMKRTIPGYRREHRSFGVRLLDLFHRLLTLILVIAGPMIVFYVVEDWVLFSISILLLLGIAWTVGKALPYYWQQMQLFLNIGSVREGERVFLNGLPWKVKQINFYSTLENPVANLRQRVPLDDFVEMKSRPLQKGEPWFPCKQGDWVIMQDGTRGKVIGISQELVTLVQRGGAHRTYTMSDFLGGSPLNLAPNFRIKEVFGITYDLQAQSTAEIPAKLEAHVAKRIEEEGYADKLLNLRVEFAQANTSSLDLVVIADFEGELGDLYNRLRRAIQRWCVEASTGHGWEIPFQQITLHHAAES
jgi:hypothetical protein